jgi:cytochrome c-type biogenesis protein CcmH
MRELQGARSRSIDRRLRAQAAALLGVLLLVLLGLYASAAGAKDAPPAAADPELESRMQRIASELRCLVCQNETLAASHASLAEDLREQMRVMLRQGSSDDDVRRFMTDRYGDFVLYRPPLKPTTLALWFGPLALLAVGFGVLVIVLRRRNRLGDEHFEADEGDDLDASDPRAARTAFEPEARS